MTLIAALLAAVALLCLFGWHLAIRDWGRTIELWTDTLNELETVEMENDHLRAELAALGA